MISHALGLSTTWTRLRTLVILVLDFNLLARMAGSAEAGNILTIMFVTLFSLSKLICSALTPLETF